MSIRDFTVRVQKSKSMSCWTYIMPDELTTPVIKVNHRDGEVFLIPHDEELDRRDVGEPIHDSQEQANVALIAAQVLALRIAGEVQ